MTATAAQIQGEALRARADNAGQLSQILSLGMDGARQIGLRLRAVLFTDDNIVVSLRHVHSALKTMMQGKMAGF